MPPHAAQNSSTRKRPAPRDDNVGDVVHVKPSSASSTSLGPSSTHPSKKPHLLALGAGNKATTRSSRISKTTTATVTMSASIKDGNPTPRVSRAKKGKRVHGCPHHGCDKIFTRAEHLRRHQLNHNTDVYFKCNMCDRTFVRHDLLSRHQERQ
ncbi:hypothetical protein DFH27DRAFT_214505 [Peziza echinospora]|nr:hypothetical protein DFH27DRAFT_214505 [Peziza echinospora]